MILGGLPEKHSFSANRAAKPPRASTLTQPDISQIERQNLCVARITHLPLDATLCLIYYYDRMDDLSGDQDYGSAAGWDPAKERLQKLIAESKKKYPRAYAPEPEMLYVRPVQEFV